MKLGRISSYDPHTKTGWITPADEAGKTITGPLARFTDKEVGDHIPIVGALVRYEDADGPPIEHPGVTKARPKDPTQKPAPGTPASPPPTRVEARLVTAITWA